MEKLNGRLNSGIKVYRNELKYYISYNDYLCLRNIFRKIMHRDKNSNEDNEYFIRSLYFDTLLNDDYYDKIVGVMNRKKIRLRIYGVEQEKVKIEIKNKFSQYMLKETTSINREDAMELIRGNREVLLKYDDVAHRVYYFMSKDYYKSSVIIDYEREAYTYPLENIRITFDKNIRANGVDFDIFNKDLSMNRVLNGKSMVLEVKYNMILPMWIKKTLSKISGDKVAISKYCLGRELF